MGGTGKLGERLLATARSQLGVITRSAALELGFKSAWLQRRIDDKQLLPTQFSGVYIVASLDQGFRSRAFAATLATGGACFASSGAAIWDLDGFDEYAGPVQVITPHDRRSDDPATTVVRAGKWLRFEQHRTARNGVPVFQPPFLLASLGETATLDEVEGAMDHVLRMKWATWDELEAVAHELRPRFRNGAPMLLEAIARRSPQRQRTDSLLETKCVQVLRLPELPTPVLQYEVFDGSTRLGAADIAYPDHGVLIETIGKEAHRSELWQLTTDCRRSNGFALVNRFIILAFSWHQVTRTPEEVVSVVMRALGVARQTGLVIKERPGGRPTFQLPAAL